MDKYEYLKFDEVVVDGTQWLKETLELVRAKVTGAVSSTIGLSSCSFAARREITREKLAERLTEAMKIDDRQNEYIIHLI